MPVRQLLAFLLVFSSWLGGFESPSVSKSSAGEPSGKTAVEVRPLQLVHAGRWIGEAVCYSPYRQGQRPGGSGPSKEQLKEDLLIISKHWPLLRTYGSTGFAAEMLQVIREEQLPLQVVLGAWIQPEHQKVGGSEEINKAAREANQKEVINSIALANEYQELVIAISVGNETQVEWSGHKVEPTLLVDYLREVRNRTSVPVTTADDYMFWCDASSSRMADEVDFIITHIHPVWHGLEAVNALEFVREKYELVTQSHPEALVVIGETGWATRKNERGREAKRVSGRMNESEQQVACEQIVQWAEAEKIATFIFEAFDEPWKGDDHPDEIEKHWGLFRVDRTPKLILESPRNTK